MTDPPTQGTLLATALCLLGVAVALPGRMRADAGPPFLSNDPGTPGTANWEINIAATQTTLHGLSGWQLPQLDVNYGVGERIQLTAEIPYVVLNSSTQPQASGWGNANAGVKWRFFDQGENGWQISAFPLYQTGGSADAQRKGIAVEGPRIFLPLEVARKVGEVSLNLEVGTHVPIHGSARTSSGWSPAIRSPRAWSSMSKPTTITCTVQRTSRLSTLAAATSSTGGSTCCSWRGAVRSATPKGRSSSWAISAFRSCSVTTGAD
jgi:hypothetical protein